MKSIIIFIFLGSVFLTSEKFVDTENTIKYYFTVIALFVWVTIIFLKSRNLKIAILQTTSFSVLQGLYVVGIFQAIYVILQYIGIYSSNHSAFDVTGSFDNPAGFIAVLSLLFPIGVYWCIKSKKMEQRLVFFSVGLILFSIIISGSRTGLLAVIISTISILMLEFHLFSKIKRLKYFKLVMFSSIILLLAGLSVLYMLRPDSANGRLLIWDISTEMVKDKPLIGFGYQGFQANYMDYQAQYFEQNPDSIFAQLADNVTHPFNEFVKIGVNYGIVGLMLLVLLINFLYWKILKSKILKKTF